MLRETKAGFWESRLSWNETQPRKVIKLKEKHAEGTVRRDGKNPGPRHHITSDKAENRNIQLINNVVAPNSVLALAYKIITIYLSKE